MPAKRGDAPTGGRDGRQRLGRGGGRDKGKRAHGEVAESPGSRLCGSSGSQQGHVLLEAGTLARGQAQRQASFAVDAIQELRIELHLTFQPQELRLEPLALEDKQSIVVGRWDD